MSVSTESLSKTPPRDAATVREQLADLVEIKKLALAYGERDFPSKVTIRGILAHERELLDELHAAELFEAVENTQPTAQPDSTHPPAPTQAGV